MPDKSAPLAFLEKSHCVPILLALYRNGMLNRNQLYNELGQTINIVIKRVEFLIEIGLIEEKKMKVKPKAKFLFLTGKGWDISNNLDDMETIMDRQMDNRPRRIHLGDDPFWNIIDTSSGNDSSNVIHMFEFNWSNYDCPNCKAPMHLFKDGNIFTWICFDCGTKKPSSINEAVEASLAER